MARWFSSQLRAAEQLLAKIDQTAAGSLKKEDRQRSGLFGSDSEYSDTEQSHGGHPSSGGVSRKTPLSETEVDFAPPSSASGNALPASAPPNPNPTASPRQPRSSKGRQVASPQAPKSGRRSGRPPGSASGASTPYDSDASEADDWTELLSAAESHAASSPSGMASTSGRSFTSSHVDTYSTASQSKPSRAPRPPIASPPGPFTRTKSGSGLPSVVRTGPAAQPSLEASSATSVPSVQSNDSRQPASRLSVAGGARQDATKVSRVAEVSTADALAAARRFRTESQKRRMALEGKDEETEQTGTSGSEPAQPITSTSNSTSARLESLPISPGTTASSSLKPTATAAKVSGLTVGRPAVLVTAASSAAAIAGRRVDGLPSTAQIAAAPETHIRRTSSLVAGEITDKSQAPAETSKQASSLVGTKVDTDVPQTDASASTPATDLKDLTPDRLENKSGPLISSTGVPDQTLGHEDTESQSGGSLTLVSANGKPVASDRSSAEVLANGSSPVEDFLPSKPPSRTVSGGEPGKEALDSGDPRHDAGEKCGGTNENSVLSVIENSAEGTETGVDVSNPQRAREDEDSAEPVKASASVPQNGGKQVTDGEERQVPASSEMQEASKEAPLTKDEANPASTEIPVDVKERTRAEGELKEPAISETMSADADKVTTDSRSETNASSPPLASTAAAESDKLPPGGAGVANSSPLPSRPEDLLDAFVEQMMLKPSKMDAPLGVQREGMGAGTGVPAMAPGKAIGASVKTRMNSAETKTGGKGSPRAGKRQGALGRVVGQVVGGHLAIGKKSKKETAAKEEVEDVADSGAASSYESSTSGSESGSEDEDEDDEARAEMERAAAMKAEMEKAAATAAALARESSALETARVALKERQLIVARLATEKEAMQQMVAEAAEQHAKEVAQLRASTMEKMAAAAVEKEAHTHTRQGAQDRETQLEGENAAQATALAAAQRALEEAVERVVEARAKVEGLEASRNKLERELQKLQRRLTPGTVDESQSVDRTTREADEAMLLEEIARLEQRIEERQQQAKDLEEQLELVHASQRQPSEVERELENRLKQLIDHLIQKQGQVEALASEKATLALRLETVSAALRDEKASAVSQAAKRKKVASEWTVPTEEDLEFGLSRAYALNRTRKMSLMDTDFGYGGKVNAVLGHLTDLAWDIDSLVIGGASYIRSNSVVRRMVWGYLLLLHFWVLFVWFMHSSGPPLVEPKLP